jgi:adenosine deaminase
MLLPGPPSLIYSPPPSDHIHDKTYQLIRTLTPKVALHEHDTGSSDLALLKMNYIKEQRPGNLSWEAVREDNRFNLDTETGKPRIPLEQIRKDGSIRVQPNLDESRLNAYREVSRKNNPLIKNTAASYMAAHLFALNAVDENTRYFEYRLNPYKGTDPPERTVRWVNDGLKDAQKRLERSRQHFAYGLILLAKRHGDTTVNPQTGRPHKVDDAVTIARLAVKLRREGTPVVGIDLGGDELNCPVTDFAPMFQVIQQHNRTALPENRLGITVHAGETPRSGPLSGVESVQQAIDLAWTPETPVRIGHGIQVINSSPLLKAAFQASLTDPNWQQTYPKAKLLAASPLLKTLMDKQICLEMCPKSNVQTAAVTGYRNHPAVFLSRLGVPVSISADNRTISNTDVTNEFVKLHKYCQATYQDRKRMVLDGARAAFIFNPALKASLMADLNDRFAQLEAQPSVRRLTWQEHGRPLTPWRNLLLTLQATGQAVRNGVRHWLREHRFMPTTQGY